MRIFKSKNGKFVRHGKDRRSTRRLNAGDRAQLVEVFEIELRPRRLITPIRSLEICGQQIVRIESFICPPKICEAADEKTCSRGESETERHLRDDKR